MELHNIRDEYTKRALSQHDCHENPISQFEQWQKEAIHAQVNEPTAMNIATVDEQGFVFFTNYLSRKGSCIERNPYVALTFFWPELERQVRIEGKAVKIPSEQSDKYFATRPYTSRIGAWASEQSAVIFNYKSLLAKAALVAAKHPLNVPRPDYWGGYLVVPETVEFWQGRPSRLHDRIRYRKESDNWIRERLSP